MEVRSGGGDRYIAYGYTVPSTGAVCGGSSTELLYVLCGYWFWLFVSVSAGLRFWSGQAISSLLCFLLFACASGRAELFCLPLSYVVVVVSRRRSLAGWFVSSFALGVTQDAVFIQ